MESWLSPPPLSLFYQSLLSLWSSSAVFSVCWLVNYVPMLVYYRYRCNPTLLRILFFSFFNFHVSSVSAPTKSPCNFISLPPAAPSPLSLLPDSTRSAHRWGFVMRLRRTGEWSVCHAEPLLLRLLLLLLLRGSDLDNHEELERSEALEPLQLQQCHDGVSCVTQCPI